VALFSCTTLAPSARYTPSLHDALPISAGDGSREHGEIRVVLTGESLHGTGAVDGDVSVLEEGVTAEGAGEHCDSAEVPSLVVRRSEEHTSELQSRFDLVCRLLLEKKKP